MSSQSSVDLFSQLGFASNSVYVESSDGINSPLNFRHEAHLQTQVIPSDLSDVIGREASLWNEVVLEGVTFDTVQTLTGIKIVEKHKYHAPFSVSRVNIAGRTWDEQDLLSALRAEVKRLYETIASRYPPMPRLAGGHYVSSTEMYQSSNLPRRPKKGTRERAQWDQRLDYLKARGNVYRAFGIAWSKLKGILERDDEHKKWRLVVYDSFLSSYDTPVLESIVVPNFKPYGVRDITLAGFPVRRIPFSGINTGNGGIPGFTIHNPMMKLLYVPNYKALFKGIDLSGYPPAFIAFVGMTLDKSHVAVPDNAAEFLSELYNLYRNQGNKLTVPYGMHEGYDWQAFHFDTTFNVIRGSVTDPFDNNAWNKLIEKVANRARGTEFNGAVALAEIDETAGMIIHRLRDIFLLVQAVASMNPKRIFNALKDIIDYKSQRTIRSTVLSLAQSPAKLWLELRFGWEPLMSDLGDLFDSYVAGTLGGSSTHYASAAVKVANAVKDVPITQFPEYPGFIIYADIHRTVKVRISLIMGSDQKEDPLNLNSIFETIWERIPFSFIVDYFLPIADYLSARALSSNLRFIEAWESRTDEVEFNNVRYKDANGNFVPVNDDTVKNISSWGWLTTAKYECVVPPYGSVKTFTRRRITTLAPRLPSIKSLESAMTVRHRQNLAALAIAVIKNPSDTKFSKNFS